MNLGQLLDGLVTIYNLFKNHRIKTTLSSVQDLRKGLKEIHELLPENMQTDYRKRKLRMREEELAVLDVNLQNQIVMIIKQSLSNSVDIFQLLSNTKGAHTFMIEVSKLFSNNTEFSKYFFKELSKDEEEVFLLEIILADRKRLVFPLRYGTITIGRKGSKGDNVLILPDGLLSRPHCQICRDRTHITIEDLHSRNATYLNGAIIRSIVPFEPKDEIKIGYTRIRMKTIKQNDIIDTLETQITPLETQEDDSSYPKFILIGMAVVALILFVLIMLTAFWSQKNGTSSSPKKNGSSNFYPESPQIRKA